MGKIDRLTEAAAPLSDDQIGALIDYARYLAGSANQAPLRADILASIDRGLADAQAGAVVAADDVLDRLRGKIASSDDR